MRTDQLFLHITVFKIPLFLLFDLWLFKKLVWIFVSQVNILILSLCKNLDGIIIVIPEIHIKRKLNIDMYDYHMGFHDLL